MQQRAYLPAAAVVLAVAGAGGRSVAAGLTTASTVSVYGA